jgi:hypothetical protein
MVCFSLMKDPIRGRFENRTNLRKVISSFPRGTGSGDVQLDENITVGGKHLPASVPGTKM